MPHFSKWQTIFWCRHFCLLSVLTAKACLLLFFFSPLQQAAILKFAGGKGPSYAKLCHNGAKTFFNFGILCSNDLTMFFIFKSFTFSLIYASNVKKIQSKNCRSMWCWLLRHKEFDPIVCANPTFLLFIVALDLQ